MESRREFLTQSAGLVAGLSLVPGFRLPEKERLNAVQLAVRNEIPMLICELHIFRNSFLPTLLSPPISDVAANDPDRPSGTCGERVAGLNHWQRATDDLMRALLELHGRVPDSGAVEAFADFHTAQAMCYQDLLEPDLLEPPSNPRCEFVAGWPPIRWRIDLEMNGWPDAVARGILSEVCGRDDDLPDPCGELTRQLPRVRRLIRNFPADFNRLAWTYGTWLPVLADIDPAFAVDALDYQRLKCSPVGNGLATEARNKLLTDTFTTGVAFVARALANNHFPKIRRLLEKPGIGGFWATVIPSMLSAVLYHKIVTLRELARAA